MFSLVIMFSGCYNNVIGVVIMTEMTKLIRYNLCFMICAYSN